MQATSPSRNFFPSTYPKSTLDAMSASPLDDRQMKELRAVFLRHMKKPDSTHYEMGNGLHMDIPDAYLEIMLRSGYTREVDFMTHPKYPALAFVNAARTTVEFDLENMAPAFLREAYLRLVEFPRLKARLLREKKEVPEESTRRPLDMSFQQRTEIHEAILKAPKAALFPFRTSQTQRMLGMEDYLFATLKKHGFAPLPGNADIYTDRRKRNLPPIDLNELDLLKLNVDVAWDLYVAFVLEPRAAQSRKRKASASKIWLETHDKVKRIREADMRAGYSMPSQGVEESKVSDDEDDEYLNEWIR